MVRRLLAPMTALLLLAACGGRGEEAEDRTTALRGAYLEMGACSGGAEVTADYGRRVYTYALDFTWQREGETVLTLTAPENIAGVTARIAKGETALEFDGVAVETGPVDSAGLSPMDAIPALLTYAREGYVAECCLEDWEGEERLRLTCRDPEKAPGEGIEADLWFTPDTFALLRGEISEGGSTVISCTFTGFTMEQQQKEPG